jgi:hypothetical protein
MRLFLKLALPLLLLIAVSAGVSEDGKRTLKGSYDWVGGKSGPLTADFFPTDEAGRWKVEFRFDFHGPHLYTGTASGSLDEGSLSGEVESDQRKRTFVFSGSFQDGEFSGTHTETTKGRESDTGTMTLKGPKGR